MMELHARQTIHPPSYQQVESSFAQMSEADRRAALILMTTALLHPESMRSSDESENRRLNLFRECFKRLRQITRRG